MISKSRVFLTLSATIAIALIILSGEQVIKNYHTSQGMVLANGQILGGDYLAFYVGGRLFREDRDRLYDLEYQAEYREDFLGPNADALGGDLPFVYPPLVAAALSPLAKLPFHHSYWVWISLGFALSILCLIVLFRASGADQVISLPLFVIFVVGYIPFSLNATFGGQITWFGILLLATLSWAIIKKRDFWGGMVMGMTYYKPPLYLLLLLVLSISRGRRFISGFLTAAVILMSLTFLLFGYEGLVDYLSTASRYTYGQEIAAGTQLPPSEGMGLVGLGFTFLRSLKSTLLILAFPFLLLGWFASRKLKGPRNSDVLLGLSLAITASTAFSVQIIKYDLALLLIPMVLGLGWYSAEKGPRKLLVLLPFLGFYFEFAFRGFEVLGKPTNAAPFLFLAVLGTLAWASQQPREEMVLGADDDRKVRESGNGGKA